jgi:nucleoside-diphosphate-sugar epimerase
MNRRTAFVSGAAGFVGRRVVEVLADSGVHVRAGIHHHSDTSLFSSIPLVEPVLADVCDSAAVAAALDGVDEVYHFAALLDHHAGRESMVRVNVDGTKMVWEFAAGCGVRKALLCSTTAVYGLLAGSGREITEDVPARAIEAYGNTKLRGESAALEVAAKTGLNTTIIRPVAIFGPGEHTPFGRKLRDAAVSKLLVAGGFRRKRFSFVHLDDVAAAAVHLMTGDRPSGEIYNIAAGASISFEDAFDAYVRVLRSAGSSYLKIRRLALLSTLLHSRPGLLDHVWNMLGERYVFRIWNPGFDLVYSSAKLMRTGFIPGRADFEDVLASCLEVAGDS